MRKNRERIIYMTADCVQWLISIKIKKLNQGHCLIKKVAASLLSAKQCTDVLNTTDLILSSIISSEVCDHLQHYFYRIVVTHHHLLSAELLAASANFSFIFIILITFE